MTSQFKSLLLAALGTVLIASPASATTKNDLVQCKAAIDARGDYSMDEYNVKFRSTKGNSRVKTMKLQLHSKLSSDRYMVNCKLRKGEVIDLQISPK